MRIVDKGEGPPVPSWAEILVIIVSCLIFGVIVAGILHWMGWL
jgi:hypothetical protein